MHVCVVVVVVLLLLALLLVCGQAGAGANTCLGWARSFTPGGESGLLHPALKRDQIWACYP
jgi:hypothetical protein